MGSAASRVRRLWFLDTRVEIRVSYEDGTDRISMLEHQGPHGFSPPLHIRRNEDKIFHVLEGGGPVPDRRQRIAGRAAADGHRAERNTACLPRRLFRRRASADGHGRRGFRTFRAQRRSAGRTGRLARSLGAAHVRAAAGPALRLPAAWDRNRRTAPRLKRPTGPASDDADRERAGTGRPGGAVLRPVGPRDQGVTTCPSSARLAAAEPPRRDREGTSAPCLRSLRAPPPAGSRPARPAGRGNIPCRTPDAAAT